VAVDKVPPTLSIAAAEGRVGPHATNHKPFVGAFAAAYACRPLHISLTDSLIDVRRFPEDLESAL
jgi:hypothetical protein